jgi:hypothetical protein
VLILYLLVKPVNIQGGVSPLVLPVVNSRLYFIRRITASFFHAHVPVPAIQVTIAIEIVDILF